MKKKALPADALPVDTHIVRIPLFVAGVALLAPSYCHAAPGEPSLASIEAEYRVSVRLPAARLLQQSAPEIAKALERDSCVVEDSVLVLNALRRLGRAETPPDERDMLRFGVHHLLDRFAWHSPSDSFLDGVGAAIRPFGISLDDYTGGASYHGTLTDSLIERPWINSWREFMFVRWMEHQCDLVPDGDAWKLVIRRGEEYLRHRSRSASAPEVMLHVAEAHETAWSLGAFTPKDGADNTPYRSGASDHRVRAMNLYERYLELKPNAADADEIRSRLKKIRAGQDTDFRKYTCFDEC